MDVMCESSRNCNKRKEYLKDKINELEIVEQKYQRLGERHKSV
jgi:hypothetical protein